MRGVNDEHRRASLVHAPLITLCVSQFSPVTGSFLLLGTVQPPEAHLGGPAPYLLGKFHRTGMMFRSGLQRQKPQE